MLWTLIALAAAGLGGAGIGLVLRHLSGNRLGKWCIPVFAGAGMLAYQIYYEYHWFEHQAARQPAASVVVAQAAGPVLWRPWSYVWPITTAFTVLDKSSVSTAQVDGQTLARFMLYRFEKQHIDRVTAKAHVFNCATFELVPITSDGQPELRGMRLLATGDPLYRAVCS